MHVIPTDFLHTLLTDRRQQLMEELAGQNCKGATQEAITAFAMESIQLHGALSEVEALLAHPMFTPQQSE